VGVSGHDRDVLTSGGARRAFLYRGDGDDLLNGNAASRAHLDGGNGRDTFVIVPGRGQAIIHSFEDGMDSLRLIGLSFSEISIVPRGSATTINIASTGVTLATLSSIDQRSRLFLASCDRVHIELDLQSSTYRSGKIGVQSIHIAL